MCVRFLRAMECSGWAGDLAISLETAARQAARFGHSLRDEVRVLLRMGCCTWRASTMRQTRARWRRTSGARRELGVETSLIAG